MAQILRSNVSSTLAFLHELGTQLSATTGDVRKTAFLFQRPSVVMQRYNSVLTHELFGDVLSFQFVNPFSPFSPTFFLTLAKISLPKRSVPYWSNPPF